MEKHRRLRTGPVPRTPLVRQETDIVAVAEAASPVRRLVGSAEVRWAGVIGIVVLVCAIVGWFGYELLWARPMEEIASGIDPVEFAERNEVRKTAVTAAGAAFVAATTVFALLNWRLGQRNLEETRRNIRATERRIDIERDGQLTDRFTRAVELMGASLDGEPQIEARVGGLHALGQVAVAAPGVYGSLVARILADYVRRHERFRFDPEEAPWWYDAEGKLSVPPRRDDAETALAVLNDVHPVHWEPHAKERSRRSELELALNPLLLDDLNLEASQLRGVRLVWNGPMKLDRSMLMDTQFYSLGSISARDAILGWTLLRSWDVVDVTGVASLDNVRIECRALFGLSSVPTITPTTRIIASRFENYEEPVEFAWRADDVRAEYVRVDKPSIPYAVFMTERPQVPSLDSESDPERWLRWRRKNGDPARARDL